jgi:hypothetical protein
MTTAQVIPSQEAKSLLEKLSPEERDYVLFHLVSEKVDEKHLGAKVPIRRPDGSVFGFFQTPKPPAPEEIAEMLERARSANSSAGRSTRDLLERMKAGDEDGVRKFIKD